MVLEPCNGGVRVPLAGLPGCGLVCGALQVDGGSEGHFTPKNLVHLWQKSFCFQEKSIKNPHKSFCSEKISYTFPNECSGPRVALWLGAASLCVVSRCT